MTPLFNVTVSSLKTVSDMPETWSAEEYRALLTQLEFEDEAGIADGDLLEMVMMALQDMKTDDAADAVLLFKLKDCISAGARQNIVQDLLSDQRPWEEAADVTLHTRIFASAVLLQKAIPKQFSKPDIMQLILHVTALKPEAKTLLSHPPQPAFITRMLADGMNENSILERLFDEKLTSHSFPEAEAIIWQPEWGEQSIGEQVMGQQSSATLTLYSCVNWLEDMEGIYDFQSNAYNDSDVREKNHG